MNLKNEESNAELKKVSETWWTNHSQDYLDPGDTPHLGVPKDMSDNEFLSYLENIDLNFYLDGYFAQKKGEPLFSHLIPNLKGKRVLEVGCGLGAHSEAIAALGADLTSIDLSERSVEITKRRLELKGLKAKVMVQDAENLLFENESFDYVWSWGVIHHSPNTKKCSDEITRVLKSGGKIGIMLYHKNSFYNWINVIFRYGILRGELLTKSVQELRNRYTDGKEQGGCPLAKYYSKKEIREDLFSKIKFTNQICYEPKSTFSFFIPSSYKRKFESHIPDKPYTFLWSNIGFLCFSEGEK